MHAPCLNLSQQIESGMIFGIYPLENFVFTPQFESHLEILAQWLLAQAAFPPEEIDAFAHTIVTAQCFLSTSVSACQILKSKKEVTQQSE